MDPKWRVRAAWVLLTASVVGWPISALTFARDEPPVVLGLSWFAITITALDLLSTNQVHEKQAEETDDD
jgi:uncharacterized membrane protein YfcA